MYILAIESIYEHLRKWVCGNFTEEKIIDTLTQTVSHVNAGSEALYTVQIHITVLDNI